MADNAYGNSDFHQQTGKRKHRDRERYQAPGVDDEDDEADYENIEDSIEMEEKKPNQTEAFKEEPKTQAATNHNVCGTKSIVFLYVLLIASSVMWAALLSLLFVKCTAEIQTLKTLLTEKDSQMRANFENYVSNGTAEIQTLKTLLTEKDSQIVAKFENYISKGGSACHTQHSNPAPHLFSLVCANTCSGSWNLFNGAFYYFSKENKVWKEARTFCQSQNSDLAVINSDEELDYLKSRIGSKHHWLGLSDSETEGSWKWVDGRPVEQRQVLPNDAFLNLVQIH
ncbi:C-type lectin domain family 4 member F-like isoform X2 [Acipenser oxyrinchus oxyrinchus]|uniref:C-type lectin domain family 4 member F-like isoform X2 n=1 Tax=Acipenser oxyrinchus oxyrinchus TaxID=40147 RepID=A0AAD8FNT4_ACIOX|nr:C-type lectin domain family 4 member F-like isoform X2 [Acipenser oxyrinchus oxyrinchus]